MNVFALLLLTSIALSTATVLPIPTSILSRNKPEPAAGKCVICEACKELAKFRFKTFSRGVLQITSALDLFNGVAFILFPSIAREVAGGLPSIGEIN